MNRGDQLLSKYLAGVLAPEERYELEKLALDDPLLAEAWEGLSAPYAKDNLAALTRLKARLGANANEAKVVPLYKKLWPYAVAASFALVAAIGYLVQPKADQAPMASADPLAKETSSEMIGMAVDEMTESAEVTLNLGDSEAIVAEVSTPSVQTKPESPPPTESSAFANTTRSNTITDNTGGAIASTTKEVPVKSRSDKTKNIPIASSSEMLATQAKVVDKEESTTTIIEEEALEGAQEVVLTTAATNAETTLSNAEADFNQSGVVIYTNVADTAKEKEGEKMSRTRRTADMEASDDKIVAISTSDIAKQMDMPRTPIVMGEEPTPANGMKAYIAEVNKHMELEVSEFFMRGIRLPYEAMISFKVNDKGEPIDIKTPENLGKDIGNQIKEAMQKSSPWINAPTDTIITFKLPLKVH